MQRDDIAKTVRRLSAPPQSITFVAGLSDSEVRAAEQRFAFRFPPDLLRFLRYALPIGARFPNWRDLDSADLKYKIDGPIDGCLYDVRNNDYWMERWGPRPKSVDEAIEVATSRLIAAPKLIPIYAHRYICETPDAEGNPILSVSQTDIIYYGSDLADYLEREFFASAEQRRVPVSAPDVPFWSAVM